MQISIISAIGKNNEIGQKNALLWNLPADMQHFRETTTGKTIVMGQKTHESIGRPLPNRRNVVLTLDSHFYADGIEIFHSVDETLEDLAPNEEEIFVIGGAQIYKLFIDKADKLYITHVDAEFPEADAFFPAIDVNIWKKIKSEKYLKNEKNAYDLEFAEYERIDKK